MDNQKLLQDIKELLRMGVTVMQEKIANVPDEQLALRLASSWTFFFGAVLPYIEAIFEPLSSIETLKPTYEASGSFIRDCDETDETEGDCD